MRISLQRFVLLLTLCIGFVFSGRAQGEEYTPVKPYELSFGLMGFMSGTESGEGGVRILSGTFKTFLCEGQEIAVVTHKVEEGIIEARDYGKIRVSVASGKLIVHLTPSQKKKLLEDIRQ